MANDNKITLLDWIEKNPREYTYFALGSAPRYTEMSKFTAEIDQIYPRFLRKVNKTIRIIHFDQLFERDDNFAFLYEYFDSLGFNHSMINNTTGSYASGLISGGVDNSGLVYVNGNLIASVASGFSINVNFPPGISGVSISTNNDGGISNPAGLYLEVRLNGSVVSYTGQLYNGIRKWSYN